jgi:hypothetical protein
MCRKHPKETKNALNILQQASKNRKKPSIIYCNLQEKLFFSAFFFSFNHFQQLEVPLLFTSQQNMRTRGSGSAVDVITEKPERKKRVTLTQKTPSS